MLPPRWPDPDVADLVLDHCFALDRTGLVVVLGVSPEREALRAYCDESGTDAPSPWVTMAAWVTDQSRWKILSGEWRRVLETPPAVRESKAADLEARRNDFRGWRDWQVEVFRLRLSQLIDSHVRFGVSISVRRSEYQQIVPQLPQVNEHPFGSFNDPYVWLMAALVGLVLESKHLMPHERVAFIFDRGHVGVGKAEDFFYWMVDAQAMGSGENRIVRKFMKEDSVEFPPLQAADLYAWGINRGTRLDTPTQRESIEVRSIVNTTVPMGGGLYSADGLRESLSRIGTRGATPWELRKRRRRIEDFTP